jgi:hypothetical protein
MHRRDDMQFGQALVGNFLVCEHLRYDAVYLATVLQHRIREDAHDAFVGAAVDEFKFVSNQHIGQFSRSSRVFRQHARAGTTINADPAHCSSR